MGLDYGAGGDYRGNKGYSGSMGSTVDPFSGERSSGPGPHGGPEQRAAHWNKAIDNAFRTGKIAGFGLDAALTMSNPITALINALSKLVTQKTIGQHSAKAITNTCLQHLAYGKTPQQAVSAAMASANMPDQEKAQVMREVNTAASNYNPGTSGGAGMPTSAYGTGLTSALATQPIGMGDAAAAATVPGMPDSQIYAGGAVNPDAAAVGILQDWQDFENRFRSPVPSLDIKLPNFMGGSTIPLAPKAWGNMESKGLASRQNLISDLLGFQNSARHDDDTKPDKPNFFDKVLPALAYGIGGGWKI